MELNINTMVEHQVSPDEYVYLYYLVNNKICPVKIRVDIDVLQKKGFLKKTENRIVARKKSLDLFISSKPMPANTASAEISATKQNVALAKSVDTWIQEWRELFPAGVKSGGYPVRSPKSGCVSKMKTFIKKNKGVTKELIFEATKKYVAERALQRYEYMKLAQYFISKDNVSLLEGYVEIISLAKTNGEATNTVDTRTNTMTDDI